MDKEMGKQREKKADEICCSFCEKPASIAGHLVKGPADIFICEECISICNEIILKEDVDYKNLKNIKNLQEAKNELLFEVNYLIKKFQRIKNKLESISIIDKVEK